MGKDEHIGRSRRKRSVRKIDPKMAANSIRAKEVRPLRKHRPASFCWEHDPIPARQKTIRILVIPDFSARGMRLVYGRGDHFPGMSCGLDLYARKDGRLFARFTSPGKRVTYRSYEIVGLKLPSLPPRGEPLCDEWVPNLLRILYEEGVNECMD